MNETTVKITGMSCSGCENRIQNTLKTLDGVEEVKADYTTGIVKVTTKNEVPENAIKAKLPDLGFEIEED